MSELPLPNITKTKSHCNISSYLKKTYCTKKKKYINQTHLSFKVQIRLSDRIVLECSLICFQMLFCHYLYVNVSKTQDGKHHHRLDLIDPRTFLLKKKKKKKVHKSLELISTSTFNHRWTCNKNANSAVYIWQQKKKTEFAQLWFNEAFCPQTGVKWACVLPHTPLASSLPGQPCCRPVL